MKILEICTALDGGGVDRYLLNYCSRIAGIQFDFVVVEDNKNGILEPLLKSQGCNIYYVPKISDGKNRNYDALKKIMTDNKYDAVHSHLGHKSVIALWCAKKCGIKTRIVHAHIAFVPESIKQKIIRKICTAIVKSLSTSLCACGIDAGLWLWGKNDYLKGKVTLQNNAIETKKYAYSAILRNQVRKELGINESSLVVGHVGRLSDQKNQIRLVEIFNCIHNSNPDSYLLLIGKGERESEIKDKIQELNCNDFVKFLGVRDDVPNLLNAMDVFVFPSTFEGFPFTLIETQCNGLEAICADVVTEYVKVTDHIKFFPLSATNESWAQAAISQSSKGHKADAFETVKAAGYDIDFEASKVGIYYINEVKRNR